MQFTDFGKAVKKELIDLNKPQSWLIARLREETGLYVDGSYLYKILTGQRNAPKVAVAICTVLIREDNAQKEVAKNDAESHDEEVRYDARGNC